MKQSEIIDLMNLIELQIPVYSYKIRNTFIWPLVRLRLGYYIIETQKNELLRATHQELVSEQHRSPVLCISRKLVRRLKNLISRVKKSVNGKVPRLQYSVEEKPSKILLFSYVVNTSSIGKEKVNIYIDPLANILDSKKQDYHHEALSFFGGEGMISNDHFLDFYNDHISTGNHTELSSEDQELVCKFEDEISGLLPFRLPFGITLDWIKMHFSYVDIFKKYLSKRYPKLKILSFYDWPNPIGLSVHQACTELNITSVELQHGQSLDEDFCTSRWLNLPNHDVDFFPSIFWEWDDMTCKRLSEWIPKKSTAIVGGKLDVGSFQFADSKIEKEFILISMQNEALPDFFIKFIKDNLHLKWMFRIHPRHTYLKQWLDETFLGSPIVIDDGRQPIHYSFVKAYVHCTLSSGSAIDALFFGLKSIILNEDGYLSFKREIENGQMFFCQNYFAVADLFSKNIDSWKRGDHDAMKLVAANHDLNKKAVESILTTHL